MRDLSPQAEMYTYTQRVRKERTGLTPVTNQSKTKDYNHTSPIADASAEYKRARESSSEKTSSCSDKPRDKRARLDDDDNSDSSYGSYGIDWDKIPRQKSPLIASGPSQPTWNDEAHTSPRDSAMNGVTQGDSGVSSSGNSPENDSDNGLNNEGVEFWDNNSDDSEEEQLLDSSDSSEEDSE